MGNSAFCFFCVWPDLKVYALFDSPFVLLCFMFFMVLPAGVLVSVSLVRWWWLVQLDGFLLLSVPLGALRVGCVFW